MKNKATRKIQRPPKVGKIPRSVIRRVVIALSKKKNDTLQLLTARNFGKLYKWFKYSSSVN